MSDMSCAHCANGLDREIARRRHVLNLVALVEHPAALTADDRLRIAAELLAWLDESDSTNPTAQSAPLDVGITA